MQIARQPPTQQQQQHQTTTATATSTALLGKLGLIYCCARLDTPALPCLRTRLPPFWHTKNMQNICPELSLSGSWHLPQRLPLLPPFPSVGVTLNAAKVKAKVLFYLFHLNTGAEYVICPASSSPHLLSLPRLASGFFSIFCEPERVRKAKAVKLLNDCRKESGSSCCLKGLTVAVVGWTLRMSARQIASKCVKWT